LNVYAPRSTTQMIRENDRIGTVAVNMSRLVNESEEIQKLN